MWHPGRLLCRVAQSVSHSQRSAKIHSRGCRLAHGNGTVKCILSAFDGPFFDAIQYLRIEPLVKEFENYAPLAVQLAVET